MRAIVGLDARSAPIDTDPVFTGEARNTIVRVLTAWLQAETAIDLEVAGVGGVPAVEVGLAEATSDDEAAREVLAACGHAGLTRRAGVLIVAQGFGVRARGAKGGGIAPGGAAIRQSAVRHAPVEPSIGAPAIDRGIRVGTRVRPEGRVTTRIGGVRRGGGFTTTGRCRHGQEDTSKEAHEKGAAQRAPGVWLESYRVAGRAASRRRGA